MAPEPSWSTPLRPRRAALPASGGTISKWNSTAWALFNRAVAYASSGCGRGILWTYAGNGSTTYPGAGRPSTPVGFNSLWGLAFDATGAMYVADTSNHAIRKVDTNGIITTVAGTGVATAAGDGGLAIEAGLHKPSHVLLTPAGDIYICEQNNDRVRHVDPRRGHRDLRGDRAVRLQW